MAADARSEQHAKAVVRLVRAAEELAQVLGPVTDEEPMIDMSAYRAARVELDEARAAFGEA